MKLFFLICTVTGIILITAFENNPSKAYQNYYQQQLNSFTSEQQHLYQLILHSDLTDKNARQQIRNEIAVCRYKLKGIDFWFRYFEPVAYKKINGPLPVEWETEVFEKFETPYKREGAGLTLAELYLEEDPLQKDSLLILIGKSLPAVETYRADSITRHLYTHDAFFFCNRLYLLNLASIYTTGFDNPAPERIVPELRSMMKQVLDLYTAYNESFPGQALSTQYLQLYKNALAFVQEQPDKYDAFDHFSLIQHYINPLFTINQELLVEYRAVSQSTMDYTLSNTVRSLFDKSLFFAQYDQGVYYRTTDRAFLKELGSIGKLLFYDPVLSVNNERSCASCHQPTAYFTQAGVRTSFQLNGKDRLTRNTPTLLNSRYNHLLHLDGKHLTLQEQAQGVITNPIEMGSQPKAVLQQVLNIPVYKNAFTRFLKFLPGETSITLEQIASAITYYYSQFSNYTSPFDEAFLNNRPLSKEVQTGFNLFMSKAQCGTCHFVPTFSGIKPPYIGNEFEVVGTPADTSYTRLSPDKGRYEIHKVPEMLHAFRTGSLRNTGFTAPYMHNGVFATLEEVISFYDGGGGVGRQLPVSNQTLSPDLLLLTVTEKRALLAFLHALNEQIPFEAPPVSLPLSKDKKRNIRKVGGTF